MVNDRLLRFRCIVIITGLITAPALHAQPQPPDFCFVISEPGDADKPLARAYEVKQVYRERVPYYNSNRYWLKPDTMLTLQGGDLFRQNNGGWRVFQPVVGVSESRVLVIAGKDTMRIDLPDEMQPLMERAWRRWDRPSPDVMRFKPGRWDVMTCINEYQAGVATHQVLLTRLQQEVECVPPPANIPPAGIRPPQVRPMPPIAAPEIRSPSTPDEWQAYWDAQPPLKKVKVERTSADTVWLRITGRVMLDGGCASNVPQLGVELLTDTGWVERLPLREEQMDCGMPWADWKDHELMIPLRWWVYHIDRRTDDPLTPGTYRIVLRGGNLQYVRSPAFVLP